MIDLFKDPSTVAVWSAPSLLARVPRQQIEDLLSGFVNQHGPVRDVIATSDGHVVSLENADIGAEITLDAEDRIAGLLFRSIVPTSGNLQDHVDRIVGLPGQTAVLVTTDGRVRASHAVDVPLAVGSAFKLLVLQAVADQCAAGVLSWEQVVRLAQADRSLPSGILQDWPVGTPLTVATLANLMISVSDNTATDALLGLIGRDRIEALSSRNVPFLKTREAFVLKSTPHASAREAWATADVTRRRLIVDAIQDADIPKVRSLMGGVTTDVEWFFTAREIGAALEKTCDLDALSIAPGPLARRDWARIAYKGGSEQGVLNLSAHLTSKTGRRHCIVATWNDVKPLDETVLVASFNAMADRLAREEC